MSFGEEPSQREVENESDREGNFLKNLISLKQV